MTLFPSLPVIPCEDCYLNPQTSSEAWLSNASKHLRTRYTGFLMTMGVTRIMKSPNMEFPIIHQPGVHETGCIFVFAVV